MTNDEQKESPGTSIPPADERPLLQAIREKVASPEVSPEENAAPVVFLSPKDEVRRFPILTRPKLTLIIAAGVLILLSAIVAFLLWRQNQRDAKLAAAAQATKAAQIQASGGSLDPTPTPSTSLTDLAVLEAVKTAVANYNPTGYSRYGLSVTEGIVTISGEADTQPEKDGVENVVRPLPGVKAIVNNLVVRLTGVMVPVKVNEAEAKRLNEAMRKEIEARGQVSPEKSDAEGQSRQSEADREADRKRREVAAAKIREEEDKARREEEERLAKEAADYQRRLEEQRQSEAKRRARAEQARLETSVLKLGTIAWSGMVDGVAEIVITGGSASVRSVSGEAPREVKSSFSAPVPRAPMAVNLISTAGRGAISLAQQPTPNNGYTAIVRVDDSAKGGFQRYEFTLRWTLQ
jgi:BON domain